MSDYINWTSSTNGTNGYSYNGYTYPRPIYYTSSFGYEAFQNAMEEYANYSYGVYLPKKLNKNIRIL